MRGKPVEIRLEPVDNRRLARLCGAMDANLRQIESALDVEIARRGARFSVKGAPEHAARAARALSMFYDRAADELSVEDVQLGLAEISGRNASGREDGKSPLLTRRAELQGRTPHQREYIEKILAHDITLGNLCVKGRFGWTFLAPGPQ